MNIGRIYKEATSVVDKDTQELSEQQQAGEKIRLGMITAEELKAKRIWLSNPETQKAVRELKQLAEDFNKQALNAAKNFHNTNNHQQIIYLLNQVNTINTTLELYA